MVKYLSGIVMIAMALVLSGIAAWFSVTGMTELFPSSALAVAILTGSLEASKVSVSLWLKVFWTSPKVPRWLKAYLTSGAAILLVITGLGIFGFLSAAHLKDAAAQAPVQIQIAQIQGQIDTQKTKVAALTTQQQQIDKAVDLYLSKERANAANRQKASRDALQAEIDAANREITDLSAKLVPLKVSTADADAKLGPIKFIAAPLGMTDPEDAVRIVILMMMSVFDPMAIAMMIAGQITIASAQEDARRRAEERDVLAVSDAVCQERAEPAPEADAEPEPDGDPEPQEAPSEPLSDAEAVVMVERPSEPIEGTLPALGDGGAILSPVAVDEPVEIPSEPEKTADAQAYVGAAIGTPITPYHSLIDRAPDVAAPRPNITGIKPSVDHAGAEPHAD